MLEFTVGKNEVGGFEVLDSLPVVNGLNHCDVSFYIKNRGDYIYFRVREVETCIEAPMKSVFSIISGYSGDRSVKISSSVDVINYFKVENSEDINFLIEAQKQGTERAKKYCLKYYGQYEKRNEQTGEV